MTRRRRVSAPSFSLHSDVIDRDSGLSDVQWHQRQKLLPQWKRIGHSTGNTLSCVNSAVLTGRPDPCVSQSYDHNRSGQRSGLMDGLARRAVMCRGGDSGGGGRGVFVLILWRLCDFPVVSSLLFCCQQRASTQLEEVQPCLVGWGRRLTICQGLIRQIELNKFNESTYCMYTEVCGYLCCFCIHINKNIKQKVHMENGKLPFHIVPRNNVTLIH